LGLFAMLTRVLLGLTALVALAAALWFAFGEAARPSAAPGIEAAAPTAVDGASDASRSRDESALAAPEAARSSVAAAESDSASPPPPLLALRGRVVNAAREPIEGAALEVLRSEADSFQNLDTELGKLVATLAEGVSDPEGRFRIEIEERGVLRLKASHPAFAERTVRELRAGYDDADEYEIVLQRGATVRGRVLRARDKSAVANAVVSATVPPRSFERETHTDSNGHFVLTGIPAGSFQLGATPAVGDACPGPIACEVLPDEILERDIELPLGVLVHGRITDAITGAPIVGAEVGESWTLVRSVRTDAEGRYRFPELSKNYGGVTVLAAGYGRAERSWMYFREVGTELEWDFALQPARRARGRIVDTGGEGVAGAYVAAAASEHDEDRNQQIDWIAGRTDAQGEFALEGLRPDLRHSLVVQRRGHGSVVYDFPASELERSTVELGTFVLPTPGSVRGAVLDEAGEPYVGLEVLLAGSNPDRGRLRAEIELETWSIDSYVAERATRTDARGRFGFDDVAPGDYQARVKRPSSHEHDAHPVTVAASQTSELEVRLSRGASISGRVVASDGGKLPRASYIALEPEHTGARGHALVRVDGSFTVTGLSGARYTLRVYAFVDDGDERQFLLATRAGVAVGSTDLEITLRVARRMSGVVLDLEGAPIADAALEVLDLDGSVLDATRSDAEGRFSLKTLLDGPRQVRVQPPRANDEPAFEVLGELDARSDAPIEFRVPRRKP
jgi:protocatechuate 3,4-dioxygenase beta subunit